MSDLIFGHRLLVLDFFYDDEPEVIETVVRASKMLIYFDGFLSFRIVSVLIYPSIGLLGFQLANILFAILAPIAPGQVNRVFGAAVRFLADFEFFSASSVCEKGRVYYMCAAHGISPSSAGAASASSFTQFGSDHLSIGQLGLPDDISEVLVATVTQPRLFVEFSAFVFVYL